MLPQQLQKRLEIHRLSQNLNDFYEIKDPSVVEVTPGNYMMFASIGNSHTQTWQVGRFTATNLLGPWQEIEPVKFVGIEGPQLCAPAVTIEANKDKWEWRMYIQTACFEEDGVIAYATSEDGYVFRGEKEPLITKATLKDTPYPVVGVYDVAVSDIKDNQEELKCMLYSGYRKIGCGDIYLSTKRKQDNRWSEGECILVQEQVPFHNDPGYEHYEWGLEGAKLIQLGDNYLLIGVCFMPKPLEFAGSKQRVFMAAANSFKGPFTLLGMPFTPAAQNGKVGENGHPDTIIKDDWLWVIYQERDGVNQPWYLRAAAFEVEVLTDFLEQKLTGSQGYRPIVFEEGKTPPVGNAQAEFILR